MNQIKILFLIFPMIANYTQADPVKKMKIKIKDTFIILNQIPAGNFLMGSKYGSPSEKPVHKVIISRPFYMSETEKEEPHLNAVRQ